MPVLNIGTIKDVLPIPIGEDGEFAVAVYESGKGWRELVAWINVRVIKTIKESWQFEVMAADITDTEKAYVIKGAELGVFYGQNKMLMKGRIERITYSTNYEVKIVGRGFTESLLDSILIMNLDSATSDAGRVEYKATTASETIISEICSTNGDGATYWDVNVGTNTAYGNISPRFEYLTKLQAVVALAKQLDYYWWGSYGQAGETNLYPFNANYLNFSDSFGSDSEFIFYITGDTVNASYTSVEKDISNMTNYIIGLGAGDGAQKVKRIAYAASPVYTTLAADITATDTTIELTDGSDFDASGEIDIMGEKIKYATRTGNTLTDCTRGHTENTDGTLLDPNVANQVKHSIGTFVSKNVWLGSQPNPANAEADSSIEDEGIKMYVFSDSKYVYETDGKSCTALELDMSRIILDKMSAVNRLTIEAVDPFDILDDVNLGDTVYVVDAESGLDGSTGYTVVKIEAGEENGNSFARFELEHKTLDHTEVIGEAKSSIDSQATSSKGQTSILTYKESMTSDTELNIDFYLPTAVRRIGEAKVTIESTVANVTVDVGEIEWIGGARALSANSVEAEGSPFILNNIDVDIFDELQTVMHPDNMLGDDRWFRVQLTISSSADVTAWLNITCYST